ncbi:MAG: TIGR04282 family arsenosugar biosynthesis glycosyltransferase [Jatrophihabitans sp.]
MSGPVISLGTVLVIAKQPRPGRVKTRLTPPCTPEQAAELAAAALTDTLLAAGTVRADQHVVALDGEPGDWLPAGWRVIPQGGGGLDERLAAAFDAVRGDGPAVLIGMDTPQVTAAQLAVFDPGRHGASLGLAVDGGFWAIGFADPADAARTIPGVPMSQATTGPLQLARLRAAGLAVQLLDTLTDVDTVETAEQVATAAPGTRFAMTWGELDIRTNGEVA